MKGAGLKKIGLKGWKGAVGIPPRHAAHPHASVRPCPLVPAGVSHPRLSNRALLLWSHYDKS